ncbi:hypothetical protein BV20DRAFT_325827 [Pilatotrama ljubarskyi]|nr:hypothetical protein BV20DRAFT_325827 [Pilatotrama ljubarskyi]
MFHITSSAPPPAHCTSALVQSVIATGFENDGQDQPTAGQVPSLTSSNNFINFCATVPQLPITNGQQIKTGSCNPAPMGVIASTANMPSSKFVFPKNGATIKSNTDFTIQMAISHLETGHFTNAQENYFAAPQVVNAQGDIQGHSHVVIDKLTALDQTTPTDPLNGFVFFKGLNDVAQNGILSAAVTGGLPAGTYRLASINSAANHQPALVAIAQHGSLDDMVYFTVSDSGAPAAPAAPASSAPAAPASSAAAPASSKAAAAPSATATVGAIKGANTGKTPGNQGGFASGNNQAAAPSAGKPSTGFGKGGFRNGRRAL